MILGDVVEALRDLTVHAPSTEGVGNVPIAAIAYDSRRVISGSLFVALQGLKEQRQRFEERSVTEVVEATGSARGFGDDDVRVEGLLLRVLVGHVAPDNTFVAWAMSK